MPETVAERPYSGLQPIDRRAVKRAFPRGAWERSIPDYAAERLHPGYACLGTRELHSNDFKHLTIIVYGRCGQIFDSNEYQR